MQLEAKELLKAHAQVISARSKKYLGQSLDRFTQSRTCTKPQAGPRQHLEKPIQERSKHSWMEALFHSNYVPFWFFFSLALQPLDLSLPCHAHA